jgi:hypothetical protein
MRFIGVCHAISNGDSTSLPPELCARTAFSIISGGVAAILCLTAIIIHVSTRRVARQVSMELSSAFFHENSILGGPLKLEFTLSACLCTLLGLNAVVATAVQGPAATVGNLYYATWISFLLCFRILLGCLEEMYNLHHEHHELDDEKSTASSMQAKSASTDAASTAIMAPDLFDNERARRSRRYLFLGIMSTICSASALDAVSEVFARTSLLFITMLMCLSSFYSSFAVLQPKQRPELGSTIRHNRTNSGRGALCHSV